MEVYTIAAINLFHFVYVMYIKVYMFFNKQPEQLLSFNKDTEHVRVNGYLGYRKLTLSLDTFSIDGNFGIIVGDRQLTSFIDGVVDGTDYSKTYFLGTKYFCFPEETDVKIINNLTDESVTIKIEAERLINIEAVINILFNFSSEQLSDHVKMLE